MPKNTHKSITEAKDQEQNYKHNKKQVHKDFTWFLKIENNLSSYIPDRALSGSNPLWTAGKPAQANSITSYNAQQMVLTQSTQLWNLTEYVAKSKSKELWTPIWSLGTLTPLLNHSINRELREILSANWRWWCLMLLYWSDAYISNALVLEFSSDERSPDNPANTPNARPNWSS